MSRLLERRARARARVTYVTVTPFRVLLSPSLASNLLLLLWYLTPPLSSRGSRYAHLPLPSLRQIAIPLLPSPLPPPPLPPFVAVARSGRWPRDHIVCISHTLLTLYMCMYMRAYNAYTTPYHRHRLTSLLPATSVVVALPRKIKLELQRPPAGQRTVSLNHEDNPPRDSIPDWNRQDPRRRFLSIAYYHPASISRKMFSSRIIFLNMIV